MEHLGRNSRRPLDRAEEAIAVIDSRTMERECFERGVNAVEPDMRVATYPSVSAWFADGGPSSGVDAVLLNTEGMSLSNPMMAARLAQLTRCAAPIPVMVLSPLEDLSEMILAIDAGAQGYIPASLGIDAALVALRLISAGGIFLSASSIRPLREALAATRGSEPLVGSEFTARQAAVADALRRGKSNKLIAYELNMCESTVKVHVRNIMKKLRATNRTEAGFKLSTLLAASGERSGRDGLPEADVIPIRPAAMSAAAR